MDQGPLPQPLPLWILVPYNSPAVTVQDIEAILAQHRPKLDDYGVGDILLFGSYARGEEREDSDIDLIVDFQKPLGFIPYMELHEFLETILGKSVDLESLSSVHRRPDKAPYVLAEAKKVA